MFDVDLIVRGGRVVDGTGSRGRYADVAVTDGVVVAVDADHSLGARRVLDATGHVVAPGFVDIHSHSDLAVLARPGAQEKLRQGVTTEVVGNCGISVVPVEASSLDQLREYALPILGFDDVPWDWTNTASYLDRVDQTGPAVNVATYVGLGSIRCAVTGFAIQPPSRAERERMVQLARDGLQQGAVGLSSGLVYSPGSYDEPQDIWEMVATATEVGGIYSTHIRDQGDGFLDAVDEALEVGRQTGVPVHIAHHKVVGKRNWGSVAESLRRIEVARQGGVDAGSDVYPYLAGSTTMTALLPTWALAGGLEVLMTRLADSVARTQIKTDWKHGIDGWDNRVASLGYDNIFISYVTTPANTELIGKSVAAAALTRGYAETDDFLLDLLITEDGRVGNIQLACDEGDLRLVMQHETTCFGSDGLLVGGKPHPRLHGTFPRILGHYVRDQGVLSLEQAIRKMTSLAAGRLHLPKVGRLEPGCRADIVIFDPESVAGPATYDQPTLNPIGIRDVLVSGQLALEQGEVTGVRAGTSLRRGQHTALVHPRNHKEHLQ